MPREERRAGEGRVAYHPDAEAEGDRATLSEDEALEDTRPGATVDTFRAQTGKRRGRIPGAEDVEEGDVPGSALPSEEGRRGRPSTTRRERL